MSDWLLWVPVGVAIGFTVGYFIALWREHRDSVALLAATKLRSDPEDD